MTPRLTPTDIDHTAPREWSRCEICNKYRPLQETLVGRHRVFACDECTTQTDDDIRWYFETRGQS